MSDTIAAGPLTAEAVTFARGRRVILDGVDLSFGGGELVSLLGGNGAGKTTLLRILLGLVAPRAGRVVLDGRPLADYGRGALARRLAYVPQSHQPPFPYKVAEVVALGRVAATGWLARPFAADAAITERVLDDLGIGHLADRSYTALSGGERQLVMIARAMAQGAGLIVMDEPLAGLDYGHQLRLLARLGDLARRGYGILMTTHHPDQALAASTRVVTLLDGRVDADGTPETVVTAETIRRLYRVDPPEALFGRTASTGSA